MTGKDELRDREHILVFAGGGVRAFYALGWTAAMSEWGVRFKEIVACSAGAALSLALLSGTHEEVVMVGTVMASSCLPPFVESEDPRFLDGGLTLPVPVHVASTRHANSSILVVGNGRKEVRQAQEGLRHFPDRNNCIRWFFPDRLGVGVWSFGNAEGILNAYAKGRQDAQAVCKSCGT